MFSYIHRELLYFDCNVSFRLGAAGEALPVSSEQDVFDIIDMDYRAPNERDL